MAPSNLVRVLAIDLGTSGCKAAVVRLDGHVESFAFEPVETHFLGAVGVEQEPEDWWRALVASARRALALASVPASSVAALSCSSQGEGTVALGRDGTPLGRGILWMDMRGAAAVRRLAGGRLPRVGGYDPLKLWRWIRLTGGAPALSGKDPAGHIAYLREAEPKLFAATHKFLNVLDYLNFRLTGRVVATVDSALTTWVTDNRDPDAIRYDPGLLAMCGLAEHQLPELVRCTDVVGPLSVEAAQALGLDPAVKVVAGAIDNTAAALGSGAIADDALHLYVGTSSWIAAHVARKRTSLRDQVAAVPCAVPGRYLMMAMQSAAGSNLTFLRDRLLFQKDALTPGGAPGDFYTRLAEVAAQSPAGSRGLLYLPWLAGERTPVDDAQLRGTLLGLSLAHTRADLIRAVLEGVALNTRWMLDSAEAFLGKPAREITLVGGGGQSELWAQIFADVLGVAVHLPREPIQANLRGAAFLGAIGIGALSFADIPKHVPMQRTLEPEPSTRSAYQTSYRRFRAAHRKLAPWYRGATRASQR